MHDDKQSDTNDVQVHGNNQLQCDTQLSDNSIPETASSRQSDVIKSRGYLIHVPCVRTQIAYIGRICIHLVCTKSTRVSRNSWMDDNRGGIDDSKVGGFLTADVSLCEGKKSGDIWKPRNRFRVTSQMSIYLVISSRCQTVKKNGGGMSNEFSRILVTRFRERKAYDLFRILPTGGIKSRFLLFTHPRQGCSKQIRYGII